MAPSRVWHGGTAQRPAPQPGRLRRRAVTSPSHRVECRGGPRHRRRLRGDSDAVTRCAGPRVRLGDHGFFYSGKEPASGGAPAARTRSRRHCGKHGPSPSRGPPAGPSHHVSVSRNGRRRRRRSDCGSRRATGVRSPGRSAPPGAPAPGPPLPVATCGRLSGPARAESMLRLSFGGSARGLRVFALCG